MAYTANAVWEIQTGGASTNGGGFDSSVASAGTDYSQQTTPILALTDVVLNGTTTITSVTGGFTSAMIGNYGYITGGTGGTGPEPTTRRIITAVTNTNTATIDLAVTTTCTGVTVNIGGALSSINDTGVGSRAVFTASNASTTMTVTAMTSGVITLGMNVTGSTYVAGIIVVFQLTSTEAGGALGGKGTYTISANQTVASGTITGVGSPVIFGNVIYMKSGTYTLTTTLTPNPIIGLSGQQVRLVGYTTNRTITNTDTKPLITTSTNSTILLNTYRWTQLIIRNIEFSNTATVRTAGVANITLNSVSVTFKNCKFTGFTTAISVGSGTVSIVPMAVINCEFVSTTSNAIQYNQAGVCIIHGCIFKGCATCLISSSALAQTLVFDRNVFAASTGKAINLSSVTTLSQFLVLQNNVFYNNVTSGITTTAVTDGQNTTLLTGNVFWGGIDGINQATAALGELGRTIVSNNAFGGQSGSARVNFTAGESDIVITTDPFIDGTNYNFGLNNLPSGGALLRSNGYNPPVLNIGSTSFLDVGAIQHGDFETVRAAIA